MSDAQIIAAALHEQLLAAHGAKALAEREFTLLLGAVAEGRHFVELGYASVHDYAAAFFRLSARQTADRLRVAKALPNLPELDAAIREGRLEWTKGRELLRVITPETAPTWVARAQVLNSRELERLVSAALPGQQPPDEIPSGPARRRIVFVMQSVDAETLIAALRTIRAEARIVGEELEDSAALALLARQALASTAPITSEPYRAVVHVCPTCDLAVCGEHEVSDTVAGEILCDSERVDLSEGPNRGHLTRTIPPATRRAVLARDVEKCVVPGCSSRRWLQLHHLIPRAWGGTHRHTNLATTCSLHHRLIHDGRLALDRLPGGAWRVEHLDGRVGVDVVGAWAARAE